MHLAILDNLDSFTYNLLHRMEPMVESVIVVRNDDPQALDHLEYADALIFSPGPGMPEDAGCLMEATHRFVGQKPILGVCLGMQALGLHFGGQLYHAGAPQHGVVRSISWVAEHSKLFHGIPAPIEVGLYHSWAVRAEDLGSSQVASLSNGVPMAAEWPAEQAYGVQFHPESIMTPSGDLLLQNWIYQAEHHLRE
ncbi:MAG: aminodeoxychorismate/anthranilate synthase component II [Schleiferiaceae bacterium]|nr:aminodeoxychorismate/anthranilate synthase component II [Schleiferiaceae bacterium]